MKAIKKLLALSLILVMVLTMMPTAMAATGGTIKIVGSDKAPNITYDVFKMFDIEVTPGGYTYQATTDWEDFINATNVVNYISYDTHNFVHWKKNTVSAADAAALAELGKNYVSTKSLTSDKTVAKGGSLTVEEDGYYLLIPTGEYADTASGVQAVVNGETVEVEVKTEAPGLPNVIKKVKEDSTNTYLDANTVDAGAELEFQTTITAAAGASKYILHDVMDEHLGEPVITAITRGGNTLTEGVDYRIETDIECNSAEKHGFTDKKCTFHIVFDDSLCSSLHNGATIVVHYKSKFTTDTKASPEEHKNTTWLTHTAEEISTDEDSTITRTFDIRVTKVGKNVDGSAEYPLEGAVFVLKSNNNKYYKRDDLSDEVTWVDSIDEATKISPEKADDNPDTPAVDVFYGVDAEVYTVVETVVPGGYTGVADTEADVKGEPASGVLDIKVINTLGQKLPETGGIGTTVFYAVGGVLVVAALAILLIKKRRVTE